MFTHSEGCILWTRPLRGDQIERGEILIPAELRDGAGLLIDLPRGSTLTDDRIVGLQNWMAKLRVKAGHRLFLQVRVRSSKAKITTRPRMFVALTKNTGTILRFRPSQIGQLPGTDRAVIVVTPDGETLPGKFHRHVQNPYFGGAEIRHWIIQQCPGTNRRDSNMYELVRHSAYLVETDQDVAGALDSVHRMVQPSASPAGQVPDVWTQLRRVGDSFRGAPRKIRSSMATRYEADPELSRLVKECFGYKCQVDGCRGLPGVDAKNFVEAHHLEHLSRGGAHDPHNLCVLCANHHRLLHRDASVRLLTRIGDDVLIRHCKGKFWVRRDLSKLR